MKNTVSVLLALIFCFNSYIIGASEWYNIPADQYLSNLSNQCKEDRLSLGKHFLAAGASITVAGFAFDDRQIGNSSVFLGLGICAIGGAQFFYTSIAEQASASYQSTPGANALDYIKKIKEDEFVRRMSIGVITAIPVIVDFTQFYPDVINSSKDINLYFKCFFAAVSASHFLFPSALEQQAKGYLENQLMPIKFSYTPTEFRFSVNL